MARRRKHTSGYRARSAKQRAQLRSAQLASAKKRSRNKKLAIGLASGLAAGGASYAGTKKYSPRIKAKIRAYPYAKLTTEHKNTAKQLGSEVKAKRKEIRKLQNRAELIARNKARRHTPEQRAEAKAKRAAYLADYNARRRKQYWQTESVKGGVRPRKPRAKEKYARRKRKSD